MLEGIELHKLKKFSDERGFVQRYIREDDKFFQKFGEAYFSYVKPGFVKGWKYHKEITQFFSVPLGEIKIVFYDPRQDSPTFKQIWEKNLGEAELLILPPHIWYSFSPANKDISLLANITTGIHDPLESETLPLENQTIPYNWD